MKNAITIILEKNADGSHHVKMDADMDLNVVTTVGALCKCLETIKMALEKKWKEQGYISARETPPTWGDTIILDDIF